MGLIADMQDFRNVKDITDAMVIVYVVDFILIQVLYRISKVNICQTSVIRFLRGFIFRCRILFLNL